MAEQDLTGKFNKGTTESKIYALVVRSEFGESLYMGIHFSLDEAFKEARKDLDIIFKHSKDDVSIDLWTYLDARKVLQGVLEPGVVIPDFSDLNKQYQAIKTKESAPTPKPQPPRKPTLQEMAKRMKDVKSSLMRQIIETGDEKTLDDMKRMFSNYEVRYMKDRIVKHTVKPSIDPATS